MNKVGEFSVQDARLTVASARRFLEYVLRFLDGPANCALAWARLYEMHGIVVGPISCGNNFTARLLYSEEYDLWVVGYNWHGTEEQICRWMCHEFFEWLAVNDYAARFEGLPGLTASSSAAGEVYFYDGGSDPNTIHHRIAQRGERICFRGVQEET